jgi:hypothetical protein
MTIPSTCRQTYHLAGFRCAVLNDEPMRFRQPLFLLFLGAFAAHCGGSPAPVAASAIEDSAFVPRSADPICGATYRWNGTKCMPDEERTATEKKSAALARDSKKSGDGLVVEDLVVGSGREVRAGDIVKLHYTGTLTDGQVFDTSRSQGVPFEFRVGQGQVIKGFDRGIMGMKVGGRRRVTIPYQLGYGVDGMPPRIPPRATLIFDLELVDVI